MQAAEDDRTGAELEGAVVGPGLLLVVLALLVLVAALLIGALSGVDHLR